MSIRHMVEVWEKSNQRGTALLMLLAIADYANQDGIAWPSIESLAAKTRLSYSQTWRLLQKLEGSKEVEIIERQGRSNLYKLPLAPTRRVAKDTPRADARPPLASMQSTPRADAEPGIAPVQYDPLINPHEIEPSFDPVFVKLLDSLHQQRIHPALYDRLSRAESAEMVEGRLVIRIVNEQDRFWLTGDDRFPKLISKELMPFLMKVIDVEIV